MAPLRARLLLLALALPTLALFWIGLGARVDVENLAMKSVGTPEAVAMHKRLAEFGDEHTVLLCYEPIASTTEISVGDRPHDLEATLRRAEGVERVRRVPKGGTTAFLYAVDVAAEPDGSYARRVHGVLASAAKATPPLLRLLATGLPVAELAISEAIAAERDTMTPIIAAVLALLLLLVYRSITLVLAVMVPTLAAVAWVAGVRTLLGVRLDPVSALQDPVLLTVGVASAVHLVEAFLRLCARGASCADAALRGAKELVAPTLLTAGTTVAGFSSLLLSSIPAVQRFGVTTAAGVVVACVLTFVIGPLWLIAFARTQPMARMRPSDGPTRDLARAIAVWVQGRRAAIVGMTAVVALAGAWSWTGLRIETDPTSVLPAQHPFREATAAVSKRLGGIETFDLLLPAQEHGPGPMALLALTAQVAGLPGVVTLAGPPRTAPSGSRLVRLLLEPAGTPLREALFARSEALAHELGFAGAVATGPTVQIARDSGKLARGQGLGMGVTLALLWIAMAIGFRSARLGFLALLPNLLPSLAVYGGLAACGRPLTVASAMIGSIMLGLTVDNTIHLVHRYRVRLRAGTSSIAAIARALHESGRGIIHGSVVLALGFGAGLAGRLETTREFGALAALAILVALLACIFLMPALLPPGRRGKTLPNRTSTSDVALAS